MINNLDELGQGVCGLGLDWCYQNGEIRLSRSE